MSLFGNGTLYMWPWRIKGLERAEECENRSNQRGRKEQAAKGGRVRAELRE